MAGLTDELDSYMYQTVGHHAIDLYAEALDLPLYRGFIKGTSVNTGRVYTTCQEDEVEDLYDLLKLVKVCRMKSMKYLETIILLNSFMNLSKLSTWVFK